MILLSTVIFTALFFYSCESSTSGNDGGDEENGAENDNTFTATINGEEWSAPEASVVFSQGGPYLDIKGNNPKEEIDIWINIPEDIEPGTYALKATGPGPYAVLVPGGVSSGTHFPEEAGELVIEHHDTNNYDIKGTFEFKAIRVGEKDPQNFTVTNGAFDFHGEYYSQ